MSGAVWKTEFSVVYGEKGPPCTSPPSSCLHKATGQAVARIDGKDHSLGKYGSPESHARSDHPIAAWYANARPLPASIAEGNGLTVAEVILRYWHWTEGYYRDDEGNPGRELDNLKDALRPLRRLYGHTSAREFGPLALRASTMR